MYVHAVGAREWAACGIRRRPPHMVAAGMRAVLRPAAQGFIIGHVTPEAQDGGPIALIETGDMIRVDVGQRQLHVELSDAVRRTSAILRGERVKLTTAHVGCWSGAAGLARAADVGAGRPPAAMAGAAAQGHQRRAVQVHPFCAKC